jgi:hypothetical protein
MAIDFFFENSLIKQISELLEKSNNAEPVPFTRPIYERSLTELVGKKEADKLISQVNLYGAFKKIPDELEHTIFFSDVKFKWNPSTKSFVSQGKVGIGNIFKNQLNRYYPCKIELVPKRSGDVVNIYLADENNNWYFFSYTINQMQAISSDEKWNTAIKELKPEKRQKEKEELRAARPGQREDALDLGGVWVGVYAPRDRHAEASHGERSVGDQHHRARDDGGPRGAHHSHARNVECLGDGPTKG